MMISVIVPLYYGNKYVKDIVSNIEQCKLHISQDVELILVNDSPQEKIESVCSNQIKIVLKNLSANQGIHRARKEGLSIATGQYVLFLDQDDVIDEYYFYSQMNNIGDAAAVVCMATVRGKNAYASFETFVQSLSKDNMYRQNAIWSPGQVLLKKEEISKKWISDDIEINGADDYFLWICMLHEGEKIAYNREILFHHVLKSGANTSNDLVLMQESVDEVIQKSCDHYLTPYECSVLKKGNLYRRNNKLRELSTLRNMYYYLDIWLSLRDSKYNISDYLKSQGIYQVSIYGMGKMGIHLYKELNDRIQIQYLIDKRSLKIENIFTINPNDKNIYNCNILVCIMDRPKEIIENLEKNNNKIMYLTDILDEMYALL